MEEDKKKAYPSLPSNYVTLVQLQERWIKQQLKQKENEQREPDQEQERRCDEQEQDYQKRNRFSKSLTLPSFPRNHRPYNRRSIKVSKPEPEETPARAEAEAKDDNKTVVVVGEQIHDQEQEGDDSKTKKKKKSKKKKRNPKIEEEVAGGTEPPALVKVEKEDRPAGRDRERNGMRAEYRWQSKKPVDDPLVPIGRRFEDLSMNRVKGKGKDSSRFETNGNRWRYRDSGRFSSRDGRVWKPRDCSLVWVRKGEVSDGDIATIPC